MDEAIDTSGRWTLTTTSIRRRCAERAAWTWAIEAAASGAFVELLEDVVEAAAEVLLDGQAHDVERLGRHLVAALLELVDELGREQPLARRDDLPELDVARSERSAATRRRRDRSARPTSGPG